MAIQFTTASKYLDCGNAGYYATGSHALMGWVYIPDTGAASRWCFGRYSYDGSLNIKGTVLYIDSLNRLTHIIGKTNTSDRYYRISSTTVPAQAWHHIATVFTASSGTKLFLDGVECSYATTSGTAPATIGTSAENFNIGRVQSGGVYYYSDNILADVRLYGAAISDARVKGIALARGLDSDWKDLIGHWTLANGPDGATISGAAVYDRCGHPGTAYGSPVWKSQPFGVFGG